MHLENFIKVYDSVLSPYTVSSLIKWLKNQKYTEGGVGNNVIKKNIRDVQVYDLCNSDDDSLTYRHWSNFLGFTFKNCIERYCQEVSPIQGLCMSGINDISVLKYEKGGHYKLHTDSSNFFPRQISCILMLNNDYEGGVLNFADPIQNEVYKSVDVGVGRLIIWPSNFAFPHGVTPLIKGTRYVVVAWAN